MKIPFAILILATVLIAGCTANQLAPGQLAKSSADVKAFLDEYPHATVIASLFSNISIKDECNNPQLPIKDYYKVTVKDPDTNMTLIAYIDADSQKTVCAIKTGGAIQNQTENETETNLTGSARGFGQIWVTNWTYYSDGSLKLYVLNFVGYVIKITNISTNNGSYEIPNGVLINPSQFSEPILAKLNPSSEGNTKSPYSITVTVHYEIEGGTFSSTGTLTGYRDVQYSFEPNISLETVKANTCHMLTFCNVNTNTIRIYNFDTNKDGKIDTKDNLFELCKNYYQIYTDLECKRNVCGLNC